MSYEDTRRLNNDLMERSVIQQVLQSNKHEVIAASNSETAMHLLQQGEIRFVIVDRATTDIDEKEFIKRLRDAQPPYYIYILLIASKGLPKNIRCCISTKPWEYFTYHLKGIINHIRKWIK